MYHRKSTSDAYSRTTLNDFQDESPLVITAVGPQGTGKSSLLNVICGRRSFETGSCDLTTTEIEEEEEEWRYIDNARRQCRLIDTPGLCTSSSEDRDKVQKMATYFKKLENGLNAIILVFSIKDIRLDAYTQDMLQLFARLLGKDFWKFVIIVFTHCNDEDYEYDAVEVEYEVMDPKEGFAAQIRDIFHLNVHDFNPRVFFLSTESAKDVSMAMQQELRMLHNAVLECEVRNNNKRFTNSWLRSLRSLKTEEITEKVASLLSSRCNVQ